MIINKSRRESKRKVFKVVEMAISSGAFALFAEKIHNTFCLAAFTESL